MFIALFVYHSLFKTDSYTKASSELALPSKNKKGKSKKIGSASYENQEELNKKEKDNFQNWIVVDAKEELRFYNITTQITYTIKK